MGLGQSYPYVTFLFFSLKLSAVDRVGKRIRDQKRGLPWVSEQRGELGGGVCAARPSTQILGSLLRYSIDDSSSQRESPEGRRARQSQTWVGGRTLLE